MWLQHLAIAVKDVEVASRLYSGLLGIEVSAPKDFVEHGVRVVFVDLGNTSIELMEPLGDKSPLLSFLRKHPQGGIHHFCLRVKDIKSSCIRAKETGLRLLGEIKKGAKGKDIIFIHPQDFCGSLVELEEG